MTQGATGSVPVHIGTATLVARDEDLNTGTIPMPTFARKFIISGGYSPQKTAEFSELQFDKFPTRSAFLCWKIRFKKPSDNLFGFSIGGYVVDQRSGDGRFIGRINILAIGCWKEFSKF